MVNILVIDVGGADVKRLSTLHKTHLEIPSGPAMTPRKMAARVKRLTANWRYDAVSIRYPSVRYGGPVIEPRNVGGGWARFDFRKALGCPVKLSWRRVSLNSAGSQCRSVVLSLKNVGKQYED